MEISRQLLAVSRQLLGGEKVKKRRKEGDFALPIPHFSGSSIPAPLELIADC
jgi:hypothetical protein